MKKTMKPLSFFFPISRVDDAQRIVEGYAFVNETVPGEGGVRLTRSAMEDATADYVANGTCREIHQPSAAGRPLDVVWDDKGALLRMKVVDDQAWRKVQEGVYRGFSVGVNPKVMRGKDVTACEWWDTSLVDRGKDRDATFTCWRSEGSMDKDLEVEVLERASFAEYLEGVGPSDLRDMALNYLWQSVTDIQYGWSAMGNEMTAEEKEAAVRETCAQFTEFMVGAVASGQLPSIVDDDEERGIGIPAIARRKWTKAERDALDEADFGDPDSRKYPIADQDDVDSAAKLIGKAKDPDAVKARIIKIAKRKDLKIPDSWGTRSEGVPEITRAILDAKATEFGVVIIPTDEHLSLTRAQVELTETLARVEGLETTISALTIERDETKTNLVRVQGLERAASERARVLEATPSRRPPVRHAEAVERTFGHESPNPEAAEVEKLKLRRAEIMNVKPVAGADNGAMELLGIQRRLTELGA